MILENLKTAGVQQAHKEDKISFTALTPLAGRSGLRRRPLHGRQTREARRHLHRPRVRHRLSAPTWWPPPARPAMPASTCSSPAPSTTRRTPPSSEARPHPVLKARMNADLHMAEDLKNTGKGNLFVIFGEPDIDIFEAEKPTASCA
jgi:adenine-specific DNA-methyltransferase